MRMINRDPDITRLLDRLEGRGLIRRNREKTDRRVIKARITPAGLGLLRSLDREVAEFHRGLLGHLGEERLESLMRLLEAARGA
jgi:DNA-binding MarR family transcriptional regulator